MSWVSGIQLSVTSSAVSAAALMAPSAFARMLPCVSTTPFGSLVEPEENWMKATSSRPGAAGRPSREMSSSWSTRKVRGLSAVQASGSPEVAAKVARRSRILMSVYSSGLPSCFAMRSSLCLCSSLMPTATGTGTMPPYRQAQNASMNCSLLATFSISLSPGSAPMRCRWCRMPSARRLRSL